MGKRFQKSDVTKIYNGWASNFDQVGQRLFAKDGQRLVDIAKPQQGTRVLDVATGRGAVLFPAAQAVGNDGFALGVDLAGEMVRNTALELAQLNVVKAFIAQMDAEYLALATGAFDLVLSGYGLFFFPDLMRALKGFRRVLIPGGHFVTTTDGGSDPRWAWYFRLLEKYQAIRNPATQSLDRAGELQTLLAQAGFSDVKEIEEQYEIVYADPEEWWTSRLALLQIRLPTEALEPFRQDAFAEMEAIRTKDGIHRMGVKIRT
jgi:ubiquinone/menaquinone biosynthesis C-methylase UbiE